MKYLALILILTGCTTLPTVTPPTTINKGGVSCISNVKVNPDDKNASSFGACQEDKPFIITVVRVSF